MASEVQILFLVVGLGLFFSGIILLFIDRMSPGVLQGGNYWATANISLFMGFFLIGIGDVPGMQFLTPIANTVMISAGVFYYSAIRRVAKQEDNPKFVFGTLAIIFFIEVFFTYVYDDYSARTVFLLSISAVYSVLAIRQLSTMKEPELSAPVKITKFLFYGLLAFYAWRIFYELYNYNPNNSIYQQVIIMSVTVTVVFIGSTLLTIAFVLLSNATNYLEIQQLAYQDSLTETYSRRAIMEKLIAEIARANRSGIPFTILLIDFDNLKEINDRFGHLAGDEVLKKISSQIKEDLRAQDAIGRFGGDEFILILSSTNLKGAEFASQRLLEKIRAIDYSFGRAVSISIGGAQFEAGTKDPDELIAQADRNLYTVKSNAGNSYLLDT